MSIMVVGLMRVGEGVLSTAQSRQNLQLDKYPQQWLENNKIISTSTPSISSFSGGDFLNQLSETILNSFQLKSLTQQKKEQSVSGGISSLTSPTVTHMDFDSVPNHVIIDSSTHFNGMDELQKQLEYDKFMNEIWIGIVFTLILISMIFCICSCFLYHQFRTWKRNYNTNVNQPQNVDVEAMKLNPDIDDPVPDYTLVSGLPSYEAALDLLKVTPKPCVIMYPSLFSVFNKNEKSSNNVVDVSTKPDTTVPTSDHTRNQQQPLINDFTKQTYKPLTSTEAVVKSLQAYDTCTFSSVGNDHNQNSDCVENRIPSYAEAITTTQSPTTRATTTITTNQTSSAEFALLNEDNSKPPASLAKPPTMLNKPDKATTTKTTI